VVAATASICRRPTSKTSSLIQNRCPPLANDSRQCLFDFLEGRLKAGYQIRRQFRIAQRRSHVLAISDNPIASGFASELALLMESLIAALAQESTGRYWERHLLIYWVHDGYGLFNFHSVLATEPSRTGITNPYSFVPYRVGRTVVADHCNAPTGRAAPRRRHPVNSNDAGTKGRR
jgi:hypothetical protein